MSRWRLDEDAVGLWVGHVLRAGVFVSSVLVGLGVVLEFAAGDTRFRLQPDFPHTLGAVIAGLLAGQAQAVIALGVLALIATPWVRVAFSLALFLHLRDRIYSSICFLLLVLLTIGLWVGKI